MCKSKTLKEKLLLNLKLCEEGELYEWVLRNNYTNQCHYVRTVWTLWNIPCVNHKVSRKKFNWIWSYDKRMSCMNACWEIKTWIIVIISDSELYDFWVTSFVSSLSLKTLKNCFAMSVCACVCVDACMQAPMK